MIHSGQLAATTTTANALKCSYGKVTIENLCKCSKKNSSKRKKGVLKRSTFPVLLPSHFNFEFFFFVFIPVQKERVIKNYRQSSQMRTEKNSEGDKK